MWWFWNRSDTPATADRQRVPDKIGDSDAISRCPVDHKAMEKLKNSEIPAACPVNHRNMMPDKLDAPDELGLERSRTISSIPREGNERWEYPSPYQMYSAMVRRGKLSEQEMDPEAITSMVEVHNFLNERCWQEILKWEQTHVDSVGGRAPRLVKFIGRPGDLSPRARWHMWLSRFFPNKYAGDPPFDRHDWTVERPLDPKGEKTRQVRYVLDFYSAPDTSDGMPSFSVDVRPALDDISAARDRLRHWLGGQ